MTISVCMIVKNEEQTIARCLDCACRFADEIVIADTGSQDKTKEICSHYTDKIFDFVWVDDFSAARNFAFSHGTMDYLMWLDADDVVLDADIAKILALKASLPPDTDAVMMRYNTGFDSAGNVTFSYFRERMVRRTAPFTWLEPVHEYLSCAGKTIQTEIAITHRKEKHIPKRNIEIYENLLRQGKELSPRGMYYYARELKDNGRFADSAAMFEQFLSSRRGWVEDNITACCALSECYEKTAQDCKALDALLRSFVYDLPRPEACCQLGYYYQNRKDYFRAAYWFEQALEAHFPENGWGFYKPDCRGYLPCLECAVCYDRLGQTEKAEDFNERAAQYKPDSPAVAYNRTYFQKKRAESSQ